MSWYCDAAPGHPLHGPYHDDEYGFPLTGEAELFERLSLEIFQAGLSWEIVLNKRRSITEAFDGFEVDRVAAYGDKETKRLLADAGIIRNRLKVSSIIDNARRIKAMRQSGGFAAWIESRHPLNKDGWVRLFKKTFRFTGPEIVNEFLMSIGYLPGAHRADCPVYGRIARMNPPWMEVDGAVYGEG